MRRERGTDNLRGYLEDSVKFPGVQLCILKWNCGVGEYERIVACDLSIAGSVVNFGAIGEA